MTDIERLNPDIRDKLIQARRPINRAPAAWEKELPILTLLHFTDPHGGAREVRRILDYAEDMKGFYEDIICTGDLVERWFGSGYGYWKEVGADRVLICLGNHDVVNNSHSDWTDVIPHEVQVKTYFEPFVRKWEGVEYTPDTTWYCKRYADNKVDLIVLNTTLDETEDPPQLAFLKEKLERARKDDFGVVLAVHDTSAKKQTLIPCRFTTVDRDIAAPCRPGLKRYFQQAVQDFIEAGGDFICYLGGHSHRDYICYDPDFPRQIFYLGPSASVQRGTRHCDSARIAGTKSEDAFNFISFDRAAKTVKIVRVGDDRDHYLRHRGVCTFGYENGEIIYEE